MTINEKRQVRIVATRGLEADADCAIDGIMKSTDQLLQRDGAFSVLWDLRNSPTPGVASALRMVAWGLKHKAQLEARTTKMGVVVPKGALAAVVGSVLEDFSGSVNTLVSGEESEVEAFVIA